MRWETDGKRRRRCEEESGDVRSTIEMLLADGEEVVGAGRREMFPTAAQIGRGKDGSSVSFLGRASLKPKL